MGLQVAAAGKIINEFTGLAFAGGEFETDNPAIRFVSAEAWTKDAQGAHITFATAPIGTSSPVEGMRLTSEGILLVGTDTASGSAKLQVSGAISVSGITYAGTLALSATDANVITLSTNGSERARVSSAGNLLVGTTTDDTYSKLQVAGNIGLAHADAYNANIHHNAYYASGWKYVGNGYASGVYFNNSANGHVSIWTGANNSSGAGAALTPNVRLHVTNGGNVLIGTTSDGNYKLDVAASGSSGTLRVYDQTATTGVTRARFTPGAGQASVPLLASESGYYFSFGVGDTTYGWFTPTGTFTLTGDSMVIGTAKTPSSAEATGTTGQVCWDASYIYVCVATNTWKRAAITTW